MTTINLKGKSSQDHRLSFVTNLLNNAESKVNHFDGIRQRNLVVAIAVFSGLLGFIGKAPDEVTTWILSLSLIFIMGIFFVLDRRFRTYSHGWQKTRKNMTKCIEEIINSPEKEVSFLRYDVSGEKEEKTWSVISILYLLLIIGGICSFFVFCITK